MLFIVSDPHPFSVSNCILVESVRGLRATCSLNLFWVAADQFPFCRYFNCWKAFDLCFPELEFGAPTGIQCIDHICHWTQRFPSLPPFRYEGWNAELILSQQLLYVVSRLIILSLSLLSTNHKYIELTDNFGNWTFLVLAWFSCYARCFFYKLCLILYYTCQKNVFYLPFNLFIHTNLVFMVDFLPDCYKCSHIPFNYIRGHILKLFTFEGFVSWVCFAYACWNNVFIVCCGAVHTCVVRDCDWHWL